MNVVVAYYNRPSDLLLSKVSPLELWTYFLSHVLKHDRWVIKKTAGSRWYKLTRQPRSRWYKLTGLNHVKVKVVPMLRHEIMCKSEGIAAFILDFGTIWGWVSSFMSRPSFHLGRFYVTHWIEDWLGPRCGLNILYERKSLVPAENQIVILQFFMPQARCFTDCVVPAFGFNSISAILQRKHFISKCHEKFWL